MIKRFDIDRTTCNYDRSDGGDGIWCGAELELDKTGEYVRYEDFVTSHEITDEMVTVGAAALASANGLSFDDCGNGTRFAFRADARVVLEAVRAARFSK